MKNDKNILIKWCEDNCPPIDLNSKASEVLRLVNELNHEKKMNKIATEEINNLNQKLSVTLAALALSAQLLNNSNKIMGEQIIAFDMIVKMLEKMKGDQDEN